MVHVQFSALGSCGSFVLFSMGGVEFLNFFVWNLQPVSPLKLIFSEGSSVFVRSVCNHGALKLRLQLVALPASFILNAFFNFASVNFFVATCFMFSFCLRGLVVLLFCSPYDDWIFFGFFFVWNFQTVSALNFIFSEDPSFLYLLFVIMGLWNCACTW